MTGLILLAAGASTRLGRPKQTLHFQGQSLLKRAVQTALATACSPVVVVLGANNEYTEAELNDLPVQVIYNPEWAEGMSSSIRRGLSGLQQLAPEVQDVLFMVCDQPFVDADLLNKLVQAKTESKKGIVACAYEDTLGIPAIFDKSFFQELSSLQGQEGAKKLFKKFPDDVISLPFPKGAIDIDTPADYQDLNSIDHSSK